MSSFEPFDKRHILPPIRVSELNSIVKIIRHKTKNFKLDMYVSLRKIHGMFGSHSTMAHLPVWGLRGFRSTTILSLLWRWGIGIVATRGGIGGLCSKPYELVGDGGV